MPCSHVFEFEKLVDDHVYECAATLRLSSECPCTCAETLPTRGLPRARCPPSDFYDFQKNLDNYVETDLTSERFFDENSILCEVRAMTCMGRDVAARSKLLAPTPLRLWCKDLQARLESLGLRPTSFQKRLGDRLDSDPKTTLKTKLHKVTSRTSRALGGCERVVTLSGLRRPSFPTSMPPWLQSRAWSSRLSKAGYALWLSSSGARERSSCNTTHMGSQLCDFDS
jgi:hypothetical protein